MVDTGNGHCYNLNWLIENETADYTTFFSTVYMDNSYHRYGGKLIEMWGRKVRSLRGRLLMTVRLQNKEPAECLFLRIAVFLYLNEIRKYN